MPTITLPSNNWRPRDYQLPLWRYLEAGGKRAVAVWHRRAGKDDICLHHTAVAAHKRVGTYWHMLPEANQARKAIWEAVNPYTGMRRIDEAFPREIRAATREQEMFIRFKCGSTWQVVGSDNFNSLVGSPPIGVVLSEWSLANPAAWAYLLPILTENGGWAVFIYTPRGKNHGERTYRGALERPDWFAELLSVETTKAMSQEALDNALAEYMDLYEEEQGRAFFEQEFHCSFDAAILGAIYGAWIAKAQKEGRVGKVEYEPLVPVNTAWDIGFSDSTAIWWWQMVGTEVRVIDYHESNGRDIKYYCDFLKEKPYKYEGSRHFVPHDATHKLLAAGGRSIIAQAWDEGVHMSPIPATSQMNSIEAARATIKQCWFDEEHCVDGLDAMKSYRYEFDEKKRTFRDTPYHDWASHGADAFEIIGQVWRAERPAEKPKEPVWPTQQPIKNILAKRKRARLGE